MGNETVVIDADTTLTLNDSNSVANKFSVVNNTTNASSNSKDGEVVTTATTCMR